MSDPGVPQPPELEPSLVITACDTYEGQVLASMLADHLAKLSSQGGIESPKLICLAREPKNCGQLHRKKNVKIVRISYDDPNTITIALRGVQTVILVPEIEPQRVDWANKLVEIMDQERVIRCILISSIGTDATDREHLDRFVRTEEKVKGAIQRWTILREGFPFQALFYWISMIRDQGSLGMSISPDAVFAPLDITNLGDALISVAFPIKRGDYDHETDYGSDSSGSVDEDTPSSVLDEMERFDGQIYTLTGPETTTGPKLAEELNLILGSRSEKGGANADGATRKEEEPPKLINFKTMTRDELRTYLRNLRNRDKHEPLETARHYGLGNILGVRGAIRLFLKATEAAFGSRHAEPTASGIASSKNISTIASLLDKKQTTEEEWEEAEKDDDGEDEILSMDGELTSGHKDPKCLDCPQGPDEPNKEPGKEPKQPDEPGKEPPMHHPPNLLPPNDDEVELILDLLDYINEGRATFQSGDLEKVAGIRGNNAKDFFKRYRQDFGPGQEAH
ncbi:hypothetical protein BC939DRAFT_528459 [Gamsiella multidivaricata]|uniref:uncharacterized protein n=1 Tax=Gamsiella multidivaricata TaxID=101098 RepID=UPI00221EB6ED|nr:uncharacterized protein BC939DRAFT_528459 [Gamsiella multidivaricata]KAG0371398.1 hypothetical protein BGZ54_000025 [Gamsiella multidivaricata]KAI7824696.1 hypothetical protein BC939DRAFT_528459 [Gamsiella multidivaricata]